MNHLATPILILRLRKTLLADFRQYSLDQWLSHIQNQHWRSIDLKLDRIEEVWKKLGGARSPLVITVAGTNGKGSSVAMLESVFRYAGLQTGSYTSPHLVRYNERICIDGHAVPDQLILDAFRTIEATRENIPLTYFEYSTLCALLIFQKQNVDVSVLETGMGGRLDAVNIIDNDLALITSVGLDHEQWLGSDREQIGAEKAGVIKPRGVAVCSDPSPPDSIAKVADSVGATLLQLGTDFHITSDRTDKIISWRSDHHQVPPDWRQIANLQAPFYGIHQRHNLAGVVAALAATSEMSRVSIKHLHRGLDTAMLPARCQMICEKPMVILDVAHNADSARELAGFLQEHPVDGETHAVAGILKDKALEPVFSNILPQVDCWYLASLEGDRGQTAAELAEKFTNIYPDQIVRQFESPLEAFTAARQSADNEDRIVVFGSFYTVGDIIEAFEHDSYVL